MRQVTISNQWVRNAPIASIRRFGDYDVPTSPIRQHCDCAHDCSYRVQPLYPWGLSHLLRSGSEWKPDRRAAKKRYELAVSHAAAYPRLRKQCYSNGDRRAREVRLSRMGCDQVHDRPQWGKLDGAESIRRKVRFTSLNGFSRPADKLGGLVSAGRSLTHAPQQKEHYSITSSARPSNGSGTVRPSALAVFILRISSTFVACCTGRSAGFSPLRIWPV